MNGDMSKLRSDSAPRTGLVFFFFIGLGDSLLDSLLVGDELVVVVLNFYIFYVNNLILLYLAFFITPVPCATLVTIWGTGIYR